MRMAEAFEIEPTQLMSYFLDSTLGNQADRGQNIILELKGLIASYQEYATALRQQRRQIEAELNELKINALSDE